MKCLFEENQKFNQWWIWVILLFPLMFFLFYVDKQITVLQILIGLIFPLFFYLMELRIKVNSQGVHYQFFPFHYKPREIKLAEIDKIEAIQYKPLIDYGGWGIKYRFKEKAYTISGKLAVKIKLSSGNTIVFGSQKNSQFEKALQEVMRQ